MEIRKIEDKCSKCMLCVKDCVSAVWRDIDGSPEIVAPEECNLCSHCLAVCPHNAIEHSGLDPLQVEKTDLKLIDPQVYAAIIRGRRSIRRYKDKPVPDDLIEQVIGLVNHAPTATNAQNVDYIVITDKTVLTKISTAIFSFSTKVFHLTKKFPGNLLYRLFKLFPGSESVSRYIDPMQYYIDETEKGRDFILHSAPVLILVHGPERAKFASENCNISATNLMNYAYSLGLGTCYIGFLNLSLKLNRKLRILATLPKGRMAYACIVMGYPAYKHANTASRKTPEIKWLQ